MQPHGYNAIADTISTLASYGAVDRWIMTYTFLALGVCVLVTALGLRTAALPGRLLLSAGGFAAAMVAFFPQPAVGSSVKHISIACFAFISLAVWPVLAWRRGERTPHLLRPRVSIVVAGVLLGMCCWYVIELHSNGATLGLSERIVGLSGCVGAARRRHVHPVGVVRHRVAHLAAHQPAARPGGRPRVGHRRGAGRAARPTCSAGARRGRCRRGGYRGPRRGPWHRRRRRSRARRRRLTHASRARPRRGRMNDGA
jgi:hypothetical membrane protein